MITNAREYLEDRRQLFSSRELLFAIIHALLVATVGLAVPVYYYLRSFVDQQIVGLYIFSFWKQHPSAFFLLLLPYGALAFALTAAIRDTYIRQRGYPSPRRRALARRARRWATIWTSAAVAMYGLAMPFVLQRVPWAMYFSFVGLFFVAMIVLQVNAVADTVPRLGKARFRSISFNIAALAPLSEDVEAKLDEFREARMLGGISLQSGCILDTAKSEVFKGLQKLLVLESPHQIRLAFNTTSAVRLALEELKHHCLQKSHRMPFIFTTDADYPAIVDLVKSHSKSVLSEASVQAQGSVVGTDAEALSKRSVEDLIAEQSNVQYEVNKRAFRELVEAKEGLANRPVAESIEELYEVARSLNTVPETLVYVMPLRGQIAEGSASSARICGRLVELAAAAVKTGRSAIILTAHVHWQTGFILDVGEFTRQVGAYNRKERAASSGRPGDGNGDGTGGQPVLVLNRNLFIVLDGAQAVGHIPVGECGDLRGEARFWSAVSYYAGCTHKWLLGKETLGFLVRSGELAVDSLPSDGSMFSYTEQFYSGYGGTINVESFVGASVALSEFEELNMSEVVEHNLGLVRIFKNGLHSIDGLEPREEIGSSIVLVRCKEELAEKIVRGYEAGRGNVVSVVRLQRRKADHQGAIQASLGSEEHEEVFLRFCFHYFHSEKDVLDLIEDLETIVKKVGA